MAKNYNSIKIGIDALPNAVQEVLKTYSENLEIAERQAAQKVGKEAVAELKATSPKRRPKYYSGWTATRQGNGVVIHNKLLPGLPHLLEHGHRTRNGGFTAGQTHIAPVEQKAIAEFLKLTEEAIRNG